MESGNRQQRRKIHADKNICGRFVFGQFRNGLSASRFYGTTVEKKIFSASVVSGGGDWRGLCFGELFCFRKMAAALADEGADIRIHGAACFRQTKKEGVLQKFLRVLSHLPALRRAWFCAHRLQRLRKQTRRGVFGRSVVYEASRISPVSRCASLRPAFAFRVFRGAACGAKRLRNISACAFARRRKTAAKRVLRYGKFFGGRERKRHFAGRMDGGCKAFSKRAKTFRGLGAISEGVSLPSLSGRGRRKLFAGFFGEDRFLRARGERHALGCGDGTKAGYAGGVSNNFTK